MKQINHLILSVSIVLAATGWLEGGEVGALLVSKDVKVTELSKNELANIFLGKKTNWSDGTRINIGYMLTPSEKVEQFFGEFIGRSHHRFKKYWVKKVFAGYGIAPKLFKDAENAMVFLKRNRGGIVFVTGSDGIKTENFTKLSVDGKTEF